MAESVSDKLLQMKLPPFAIAKAMAGRKLTKPASRAVTSYEANIAVEIAGLANSEHAHRQ